MNTGLCGCNYGVINHYITITLSPTEAGDLNAHFKLVVPEARKWYISGQGFLFKKLSTQSSLQALEVCNRNF